MALGTAGFTAALAIQRLENDLERATAVLVTNATGGVEQYGEVNMLSGLGGYEVAASTSKVDEHTSSCGSWARRRSWGARTSRPGAVDRRRALGQRHRPVGGRTALGYLTGTTRYEAVRWRTAASPVVRAEHPRCCRSSCESQPAQHRLRSCARPTCTCRPVAAARSDLKPKYLTRASPTRSVSTAHPAVAGQILAGRDQGRTIVHL
ncbi:hypothetical protein HBB16_11755 [Pseudonocardia sp. MCCB 268]|nr:hypothetical protein [Pseudonocardia cytotoxica]